MQGGQSSPAIDMPPPPNPAIMQQAIQQQQVQDPTPPPEPPNQLRKLIESVNIADKLDDDKLTKIGKDAKKGYEADKQSRNEWEKDMHEWTKLAIQTREQKTYPWPKASNVKYPLLSTAAMQFAARAYPSLVPSDGKVVKAIVIGKDLDGKKSDQADRVSTYMSYQIMHEMYGWEEDMDKLLIMLPVVGTMFKKTYFDKVDGINASKLVMPMNLIVNYWTKCLDDSERISEIIEMSPRLLRERQNAQVFRKIDLDHPVVQQDKPNQPELDDTTPYVLIEQHTYLDLDGDGYEEPYIITFQESSGKVLRITARFDDKSITNDSAGKLVKIKPINYYTKFGFIPNPDGSFYDLGFGVLLGPINESVNTLINQLIDAGSLSNLQCGFIGKGLRIKMGESSFKPGEWKAVNATSDDLHKQILPLPVKEPSHVLLELMGSLITSGKELASVAEIFVGKMPGQNTPATTTMATIEQGMKVFTAVYKRIYRSLDEEFQKLYRLNEVYLDPQTYAEIIDVTIGPADFSSTTHQVVPGADPTAVSQTEKLLKAQGLMELLSTGVLDPMAVVMRVLEAQEQPNVQQLIHPQAQATGQPVQKPDPKMLELQQQSQADQQKFGLEQQKAAFESQLKSHDQQFQQQMSAQKQSQDAQFQQQKLNIQAASDQHRLAAKMAAGNVQQAQSLVQTHQDHVQKVVHTQQQHMQKMTHAEEQAKLKQEILKSQPKQNSKSGKPAK